MTGLAWVIYLLLRLCPEVINSSSFTADVNFEVRKDDKANFYLMKSTTYQNKGEKIGNYKFLKV